MFKADVFSLNTFFFVVFLFLFLTSVFIHFSSISCSILVAGLDCLCGLVSVTVCVAAFCHKKKQH